MLEKAKDIFGILNIKKLQSLQSNILFLINKAFQLFTTTGSVK